MTPTQRELARHALGFPNRQNTSYRNHFCIGVGGDGYAEWEDLVAQGMAIKRQREMDGGDYTFHLTLTGALLARDPREHISREDAAHMREWVTK